MMEQRGRNVRTSNLQHFLGIGIAAPSLSLMVPTSSANAGLRYPSSSSSYSYDGASHGALGKFHDGDEMDEAYHHPLVRRPVHVL